MKLAWKNSWGPYTSMREYTGNLSFSKCSCWSAPVQSKAIPDVACDCSPCTMLPRGSRWVWAPMLFMLGYTSFFVHQSTYSKGPVSRNEEIVGLSVLATHYNVRYTVYKYVYIYIHTHTSRPRDIGLRVCCICYNLQGLACQPYTLS